MASVNYIGKHLRHALDHLYEPDVLRSNPLRPILLKDKAADSPMDLSQLLIHAIEFLKPPQSTPPDNPAWRVYELLSYRYIQCAKQADLARQFSCSVRQLRREQENAITVLAEQLLKQRQVSAADLAQMDPRFGLPVGRLTPIEGEYQWLSESGKGEIIDLGQEIEVIRSILRPLIGQTDTILSFSGANGLVRGLVPAAALRQALISVISSVILNYSPVSVQVNTSLSKDTAVIQVYCTLQAYPPAGEANGDTGISDAEALLKLGRGSLQTHQAPGERTIRMEIPVDVIKTILAVDDNTDILQLFERYVKDTVYRLVPCSQPENAVSLIEKEHPDIVILDVMMKSLDGWQLYQQVRASTFGKRPIIICTVLAQDHLARTLGADDLLRKPISRDDFLSALDRHRIKNES